MSDKKNESEETKAEARGEFELSEEELAATVGGSLKGSIFITPTTDISEDTRKNI